MRRVYIINSATSPSHNSPTDSAEEAQNEAIVIDGHIKVTVMEIRGGKIRLGIEAPKDVSVWREELVASPNEMELAVA